MTTFRCKGIFTRCYRADSLSALTLPHRVRPDFSNPRLTTLARTMPPKTASQQVGASDTAPDVPAASQNIEGNDAASFPGLGTLRVEEVVGDIFDAPPNAVLIHACNCIGDWGAGIAAAFKAHYPAAHRVHKEFCKNGPNGKAATATAQLIPPLDGQARRHYVGCLFTSVYFGKRKDSPQRILENTGPAMEDLLRQVAEESKTKDVVELRICKINSGLFLVPWEDTLAVLRSIKLEHGMPTTVTVFERP